MNEEDKVFQTDRRIRLGVWGLGRGLHIVEVAKFLNIDVVAGCDLNPHFLDLFREKISDGQFTDDADEFLSWEMDAVLVATYCPAHAMHSIACLKAGKHVLSEVTAFHTLAEGVKLVEAVEQSGLVYQLAENYPYTLANRYLAEKWKEGLFGELQYAEYSYLHDCLNYLYMCIDESPLNPGNSVHSWRSWLPWHYYCTHSLGPVMTITGCRPKRVISLPSSQALPGQLNGPKGGLSGVATSLIELDNGGIVRNLMGNTSNDRCLDTLFGTKGSSMIYEKELSLRLGGRGHSPCYPVKPPETDLDRLAANSGHNGSDFWVLYHFANEILNGVKGPFDIYRSADVTLPGILAYRSAMAGGVPFDVPDFRIHEERAKAAQDVTSPPVYESTAVFPKNADLRETKSFSRVMKDLLFEGDRWQALDDWMKVFDECRNQGKVVDLASEVLERLEGTLELIASAERLISLYPKSDGATVLKEALGRFDLDFVKAPDVREQLEKRINSLQKCKNENEEKALVGLYPQLCMERVGFDELPEVQLPEGYQLKRYEEGDWIHWCRIISEAFDENLDESKFQSYMLDRGDGRVDRIYFLVDEAGTPCATASAYGDDVSGYVHYVGVAKGHQGKRLGYWVSLAVLHVFRERGCRSCRLQTDDYRIPAIKTYQKLGFRPVLIVGGQVDRWRRIATKTDCPTLLENTVIEV